MGKRSAIARYPVHQWLVRPFPARRLSRPAGPTSCRYGLARVRRCCGIGTRSPLMESLIREADHAMD